MIKSTCHQQQRYRSYLKLITMSTFFLQWGPVPWLGSSSQSSPTALSCLFRALKFPILLEITSLPPCLPMCRVIQLCNNAITDSCFIWFWVQYAVWFVIFLKFLLVWLFFMKQKKKLSALVFSVFYLFKNLFWDIIIRTNRFIVR